MLNYVKLPDAIVIQTPSGPVHRSNRQFNYNKILHVAEHGTLSDLEPLLVNPPTPEGLFYAHMNNTNTGIYVEQIHEGTSTTHILPSGTRINDNPRYLGVFTSLNEIIEAYPEIFL